MDGKAYFVHPTSVVDSPCEIGEGTKIWHFCHIMRNATIGRNCTLGMNVYVDANVRIGNGVKVQNNVSLYDGVILEDDVFCGPSAVFTNVFNPRSAIPRKDEFRPTLVKRGATIGANVTIVCGVTIGSFAMIGAGSVVTRDVPEHALVYGNPARLRGWICRCGAGLEEGASSPQGAMVCPACHSKYHISAVDSVGIEP